jgi:hypothetical protein
VRRRKAVSGHLASVCNHSPDDAGALLAVVRPSLQKDVVGNIVGADAERALNDLLLPVDRLFYRLVMRVCSSLMTSMPCDLAPLRCHAVSAIS